MANNYVPQVILANTSSPLAVLDSYSVVYYNCKEYVKKILKSIHFFYFDKSISFADNICKICGAKHEQNYRFIHLVKRLEHATGINITADKEKKIGNIDNSLNERFSLRCTEIQKPKKEFF